MKRLAKIILSILILPLFLISCAPKPTHVQGDLVVHQKYIDCSSPEKPTYESLISGEYLLGPNNSKVLLENIDKKDSYARQLEITIKCFKDQVK